MRRISVRRLRTIRSQLQRMSDDFERFYPGVSAILGDYGMSATETIRNIETALAQIDGWIIGRTGVANDDGLPPSLNTPVREETK